MADDNEIWDAFMGCVGTTLLFVATMTAAILLNWSVLTILWRWFIQSSFCLPHLRLARAIGIALVVRYLTHQIPDSDPPKRSRTEKYVRSMLLTASPLAALGMGWVVHLAI